MEVFKKVLLTVVSAVITIFILLIDIGIVTGSDDQEAAKVEEFVESAPITDEQETVEPTEMATPTPTPTETSTPIPLPTIVATEAPKDGSYIIEDSNSRVLSVDEVNALDANTKQMAINEIYARHGRKFDTPEIQEYFNSKSWYSGTIAPANFDESVFNRYERSNINTLSGGTVDVQKNQVARSVSIGGVYRHTYSSEPWKYTDFTISVESPDLTDYPVGYLVGNWEITRTEWSADSSWCGADHDSGVITKLDQNYYCATDSAGDYFTFNVMDDGSINILEGVDVGTYFPGTDRQ